MERVGEQIQEIQRRIQMRVTEAQNTITSAGSTTCNDPYADNVVYISKKQDRYKNLERRGVFRRYWECTFEEIELRGIPDVVREAFKEVKEYADNLEENVDKGIGLILGGPVGLMKTSLSVAVLHRALDLDMSVQFVTMASLLDNIFSLKARNVEEWVKYEDRIKGAKILVLDDLGGEHTEGWVKTKVDAIISERYNKMLPIIITTNLTGEALKATYAERVLDRLRSTAVMIGFKGSSLRERIKQN